MWQSRLVTRFIVWNYYFAVAFLGLAGVVKFNEIGVSDLLQFFFDNDFLNLTQLIFISKNQPLFEIILCILALSGFGARYVAYAIGVLYLFFAGLVLYATEGYIFLPIDCGCFGEGEGSMALL